MRYGCRANVVEPLTSIVLQSGRPNTAGALPQSWPFQMAADHAEKELSRTNVLVVFGAGKGLAGEKSTRQQRDCVLQSEKLVTFGRLCKPAWHAQANPRRAPILFAVTAE